MHHGYADLSFVSSIYFFFFCWVATISVSYKQHRIMSGMAFVNTWHILIGDLCLVYPFVN